VSARVASPTVKGSRVDPVRALQRALYRATKADPGRRFHSLWDKILRRDVLWQIQPVEACDSTSSVNNSEGFFQLWILQGRSLMSEATIAR
jgi:hypothetical protein